jgi:branched-chain amino acid aminotransferase
MRQKEVVHRMAIKAEGVTRAIEARRKEQAQYWVYLDGEYKRYGDARLGLMTHALHYGTGVFEGIRGYWSPEHEQLFILKLREHYRRMQNSVKVLKLKIPSSLDELCSTTVELIRRNNFRQDVYIRPLAFKSSEEIGVRLHNLKDSFAIYVTPFGDYVDVERGIRCMVSSWRRVDDNADQNDGEQGAGERQKCFAQGHHRITQLTRTPWPDSQLPAADSPGLARVAPPMATCRPRAPLRLERAE